MLILFLPPGAEVILENVIDRQFRTAKNIDIVFAESEADGQVFGVYLCRKRSLRYGASFVFWVQDCFYVCFCQNLTEI